MKKRLDKATTLLSELREDAIRQRTAFLKRRGKQLAERDPYKVPLRLRNQGLTEMQVADQAAKMVQVRSGASHSLCRTRFAVAHGAGVFALQALFRSRKTREQLAEENLEKQIDLEEKLPSMRETVADYERVVHELDGEIEELQKQLDEHTKEKTSLSAELLKSERNGMSRFVVALHIASCN